MTSGMPPCSPPSRATVSARCSWRRTARGFGVVGVGAASWQEDVGGDAGDGRDDSEDDEGGQEAEAERGHGAYAGGSGSVGGGGSGHTTLVAGQAGEGRRQACAARGGPPPAVPRGWRLARRPGRVGPRWSRS